MNAIRILVWLSVSAVFWIAGGFAEGQRGWCCGRWRSAIEYVSPAVRFWIPKYGASSVADWGVEGGHMAERCAGFIIIALGESIVVTGATFADLPWTTETVDGLRVGLHRQHRDVVDLFPQGRRSRLRADFKIQRAGPAGAARPTPICICRSWPASSSSAVADELVLTHPGGHSDLRTVAERDRRAVVVSGRNDPVQAHHSRLSSALPWRRHRGARRARLVRERAVAVDAVDPDHGDPGHGRGVGIDFAADRARPRAQSEATSA